MENNAVYHFDVLPAHPQPERLESFTGYLTRLAEANGIRSVYGLSMVCFPDQHPAVTRKLADYTPPSFGALPTVAARSVPALQATTFFHLGKKFGRSPGAGALSRFLDDSLAQHLRYCPLCLAEHSYRSLTWRFLALPGCAQHGCRLLDRCEHCGQSMPLFVAPLRLGACPLCGGDLRTCHTESLDETERSVASSCFRELEFLLAPHPCETAENAAGDIGQRLAHWRRALHLDRRDVAHRMGEPSTALIIAIEQRWAHRMHLTLQDYIRYVDCLGVRLQAAFDFPLPPKKTERLDPTHCEQSGQRPTYVRESEWVDKVNKAIQHLEELGKPMSQRAISREAGLSRLALIRYPRVRAILDQFARRRSPESAQRTRLREDDLIRQAHEAIKNLEEQGRPVTQRAISSVVGLPLPELTYYPRVKAVLGQAAANYFQKREGEWVSKTLQAVEQLKSGEKLISQKAVAAMIGMPPTTMARHPRIMAIVKPASRESLRAEKKRQQAQRQLREEQWVGKVQEAVKSLEAQGKPVTPPAIARIVGMSPTGLSKYPRVKMILKQVAAMLRQSRKSHGPDQVMEKSEVASRVHG